MISYLFNKSKIVRHDTMRALTEVPTYGGCTSKKTAVPHVKRVSLGV